MKLRNHLSLLNVRAPQAVHNDFRENKGRATTGPLPWENRPRALPCFRNG